MTKQEKFLIAAIVILATIIMVMYCQIEFIFFEDGSFRLAGCVPGFLCQ